MKDANDNRNDVLERLLRQAMKADSKAAPDACLDAETLAAWADDGLEAGERAAVEAHAAGCARCQATLAAMIRAGHAATVIAPLRAVPAAPGVAVVRARRFPALTWLVPLTAVAAAVIVWIAVPRRDPAQLREEPSQAVDQLAAAARAGGNANAAPQPESTPRPVPPSSRARPDAKDSVQSDTKSAQRDDRATGLAQPLEKQRDDSRSKDQVAAEPRITANNQNALADAAPRRETAAAGAAANAPAAPAAAAPSAMALSSAPAAKSVARATAAAPETTIVSSNPGSRWRIVPGGAVQHSSDGGSTWETQQTGSLVTLAAGASPSPSVCWLVGPEGTVLLSTDGRSWRRIAFPDKADLIGVTSADDRTATVTFADGRTLSTTDAGVSWQR